MRFLLVEDEYYARKALRQSVLCWQQDAVVAEAENGVAGLAQCKHSPFDVVLMDIRMPQMDGLTLAKELRPLLPDAYLIMITGYGEFEYAQTALRLGVKDYLLKPVEDDALCDALTHAQEHWEALQERRETERSSERLRDELFAHQLHRFLSGEGEDHPGAIVAQLDGSADAPCAAVRVFSDSPMSENAIDALKAVVRELPAARGYPLPQVRGDCGVLLLIAGATTVAQLARAIQSGMEDRHFEVRVAISEVCALCDAPKAYQQAQMALDYRLLRKERIFCYGELASKARYSCPWSTGDTAELILLLTQGEAQRAQTLTARALEELEKVEEASVAALQDMLHQLCACFNRVIEQAMREAEGDVELYHVEFSMADYASLPQLQEQLNATIVQLCGLRERVQTSSADDVVAYLQRYIDEHYGENVSLKELAETRLYLNPSYVSRMFKAKTGESFKRSLTQARLRNACEMLRSRDRSIMSIASECGYADTSQFIQLFRKQLGLTPSVYRTTHGSPPNTWPHSEPTDCSKENP
ncbi:MAG: response regulator [Clostridia bacterium]